MPRVAFRPLVLIAILALMAVIVGAQAPVPQPEDQETARVVVELLEQHHMARPQIDDAIAVKWCDNFIKDLDPSKYYFLKADVEEFKKEATNLDDQIRDGNIDFAKKVLDRYVVRHDERFKTQMELLKKKHDFTVDEYLSDDPDKIDFPADKAEADERLRKKVKFDLLYSKVVEDVERSRGGPQVDDSLSRPQPPGPPDRFGRAAASLSDEPDQDLRSPLRLPGAQELGGHVQSDASPLARGNRRLASVRGWLRGRDRDRPRHGRRQGRPASTRGQDHRHRERTARPSTWSRRSSTTWSAISEGRVGPRSGLIVQPDGTKEKRVYELTREKIELKEQHAKSKVIESKAEGGRDLKIGIINLPAFYGDTGAILRGDRDAVSATS